LLCALVLGYLGLPVWAQAPSAPKAQPLPDPTPLGAPSEAAPIPDGPPNGPLNGPLSGPPNGVPNGPLSGGPVVPPNGNAVPDLHAPHPIVNGIDGSACNNCCCDRRGYWTVGGGVYYIQPVFESNPAFVSSRGGVTTQTDLSHGMDVAPLGFIGYTGAGGFGLRLRWFQFEGDGSVSANFDEETQLTLPGSFGLPVSVGFLSAPLPAGSSVTATSELRVDVWDLEATYVFHCGCWSLLTSAGARYAHMSQDYALFLESPGGSAVLAASHNFNGFGPTFSIQGQRQVGDSPFSLYGTARGSILFGSAHTVASIGSSLATSQQTDVLPIGEIEVGGQWGKVRGNYRLFAQLGFVGQAWFGGGNASQGASTLVGGTVDSGTNFGFFGGVARAGINF
jgi:hypothetical protein